MDNVESLLEELTNAHGPSGFEGPVRAIMQRELSGVCDGLETDGIGSLIGRLGEESGSPRVMMAAHMDEVGLMVKLITKEGYVMFQTLGGWLDQALINQRWVIMTRNGPVLGVTGVKTIHVMTAEARGQLFKKEQMFIDVGASSKEDAEERLAIRPGDPIAPDSLFAPLSGGSLYMAKAWDDRVGLGVIVEVMRRSGSRRRPARCTEWPLYRRRSACGARTPAAMPSTGPGDQSGDRRCERLPRHHAGGGAGKDRERPLHLPARLFDGAQPQAARPVRGHGARE